MPGVAQPRPGMPGRGLRALGDLINEALAAKGMRPAFGYPSGPLVAHADVGTPAPQKATRLRTRLVGSQANPGAQQPPDASGPAAIEMDENHVDTWRLVTLAQAGDGEAFGQLYDRYVDAVFRFVYFRVNDRALAEDFTSETFLRALRRINTFTYQGRDLGAWLVTIARNIVLDHMKSARHRLEITTADTLEGKDHAQSTESAVLDSLQSEDLMAAVQKLGDEQRECVMLRFIQGFSVSETAAVMSKTDGAIKALQHRAVRKLADLVGGELQ